MNVALSRAKHHLFIIGHQRNLAKNAIWQKLLQHCAGGWLGVFNSLWPGNAIRWHRTGSTLALVMACQYWTNIDFIKRVLWHSPKGNFMGIDQDINWKTEFENYTFKITCISTTPRGQWVNCDYLRRHDCDILSQVPCMMEDILCLFQPITMASRMDQDSWNVSNRLCRLSNGMQKLQLPEILVRHGLYNMRNQWLSARLWYRQCIMH